MTYANAIKKNRVCDVCLNWENGTSSVLQKHLLFKNNVLYWGGNFFQKKVSKPWFVFKKVIYPSNF